MNFLKSMPKEKLQKVALVAILSLISVGAVGNFYIGKHLTKLSTADKILLGGALLMFIDTLLPWQRACAAICDTANAWGGNGSFVGVLLGLFTFLLLIGEVVIVAGVAMPPNIPVSTAMADSNRKIALKPFRLALTTGRS